MQLGEIDGQISKKGYISVNDPACGAGATLIGFANAVMAKGINYQDHILFVAQDIDQTAYVLYSAVTARMPWICGYRGYIEQSSNRRLKGS